VRRIELPTLCLASTKSTGEGEKTLINQPPYSPPFPTFPAKSEKFFTSVRPNVLYRSCRLILFG